MFFFVTLYFIIIIIIIRLCLVSGKFEGKYKGNKIERKSIRGEKKRRKIKKYI